METRPNKMFEGLILADANKIITRFRLTFNLVRCSVDDSLATPDSLDARTQWLQCKLPVANQQRTCGSSYAFALTSAFAERQCIANNLSAPNNFSQQELLSCDINNKGCKDGNFETIHLTT
jgi:hypothetical protein